MVTLTPTPRRPPEYIDLVSSDSEDNSPWRAASTPHPRAPLEIDDSGVLAPIGDGDYMYLNMSAKPSPAAKSSTLVIPPAGPSAGVASRRMPKGQIINLDGEDVFIPDEEEEPSALPPQPSASYSAPGKALDDYDVALGPDIEEFDAQACLKRVLDIFPDISQEYVIERYNTLGSNADYEPLPGLARLDNIIEELISTPSYPKQEKGKHTSQKRRREDSIHDTDTKIWGSQTRQIAPYGLKTCIRTILKAEFPEMTVAYISEKLEKEKHLYQAYISLAKDRGGDDQCSGIRKDRKARIRTTADADTIAANCGWPPLLDELNAARRQSDTIRAERAAEDAKKKAEQENLHRAMERGETAECQACFDDLPMNRQIHCDGPVAHFTCYGCAETYIKSEIGDSRCRVLCTAGCGAGFAPNQLNQIENKQLLDKLAELEQEKAIRDAGMEDLEECPFCDYKAILPPIEEDFEFRCPNPDCEKVSCRRCKSVSHIPISCDEYAKENKITSRHKIEEAMTAALVRSCNSCKKQFIKEFGCNKMTCTSCGNMQCYVCSATLKNYDHFDHAPKRGAGGTVSRKCPLYDNVEERHAREVREAEENARAQAFAENPSLEAADLEIKMSKVEKNTSAQRIGRGLDDLGGGMGDMPFMPYPLLGFQDHVMPDVPDAPNLNGAFGEDAFNDFGNFFDPFAEHADHQLRREGPREVMQAPQAAYPVAMPRDIPRPPPVCQQPPPAPAPLAMQGFIPIYGFNPPAQPTQKLPGHPNDPYQHQWPALVPAAQAQNENRSTAPYSPPRTLPDALQAPHHPHTSFWRNAGDQRRDRLVELRQQQTLRMRNQERHWQAQAQRMRAQQTHVQQTHAQQMQAQQMQAQQRYARHHRPRAER